MQSIGYAPRFLEFGVFSKGRGNKVFSIEVYESIEHVLILGSYVCVIIVRWGIWLFVLSSL